MPLFEKAKRYKLILGKLMPPSLPKHHVPRRGAQDMLSAIQQQRITCIVAPRGSGKTCAVADCMRSAASSGPCAVAWYTVDRFEADPQRFWLYALAALGLPDDLLDKVSASGCDEGILVSAANILYERTADEASEYLVIDEFNLVNDEALESSFVRFCSFLPPQVHVVIVSDGISSHLAAELYAFECSAPIGIDKLALSLDELRQIVCSITGLVPDEEWLANAFSMTEGWAQGAVIAAQILASSSKFDRVPALNGENSIVRNYFAGTIKPRLPGEMMAVLLELSLFDRFSRQLCDAALEYPNMQGSLNVLLGKGNLLIVPCDGEEAWYRFNRLFSSWLQNEALQLRREYVRKICFRASAFFDEGGCEGEAAKYLLIASDFAYIENLTEATCGLRREDRETPPLTWLCRIPATEFADSPLLCMLVAWTYVTNARVADARRWLRKFEACVKLEKNAAAIKGKSFAFAQQCLTMKYAAMEGEGRQTIGACQELLKEKGEMPPSLLSMVYQSLGEAYERVGDIGRAQESYVYAQVSANVDATMHQRLFNAASYIEVQCYGGNLQQAQEECETLLGLCLSDIPIYGFICALMARLLVERGNSAQARSFVQRALKMTSHRFHIDMYLEAKMAQSRYLLASGKPVQAYEAIAEGALRGERSSVPRGTLHSVYLMQAELAFQRKNIKDLRLAQAKLATGCAQDDEHRSLMLMMVEGMMLQCQGICDAALCSYSAVIERASAAGLTYLEMKARVHKAISLKQMARNADAHAAIGDVLVLSKRCGFIQTVLDGGEEMRTQLRDYTVSQKGGNDVRAYGKTLLLAFERKPVDGFGGAADEEGQGDASLGLLTAREREILKLLNMGMSRQEIADALCISINTVKKHVANIFSKLQVSSAKEAVAKLER